ncbi:MAG: SusC/RagA family TonB-linked outer membrane protein [Chitinophagaceae bacterium]|nr:SusC/RagA family TonB-linked outer membrane protein [Chitinophagaceae bacterium]
MNTCKHAAGILMRSRIFLMITILMSVAFYSGAQQRTISGTVTTADKKPVSGATVLVKNTKTGTTTNANGAFSINAAEGQTLIITGVGYETLEYKVGKKNQLDLTVTETTNLLEDVTVTALGIKRETKALGYSTTVVKGEQLSENLSGNWTDALSGKVAGLNMVRSGGGPTGSNKIILRGENNLTGNNEALIVVDGVVINQGSGRRTAINGESAYGTSSDNMPVDYGSGVNDINPEDIESITVLKGPGAAALYGQRGANGAVIITTKSGKTTRKGIGVSFNSNASIEQVNRWPDLQHQYGQGTGGSNYYSFGATADGASTSATSSAYGPKFDGQSFFQYDPVTQKVGTVRTPWVPYPDHGKEYFETGHTLTNTITLDGGNDRNSARFSFTNVKNDWIAPNTGYNRNSVSLAVNSKLTDKLQINAKVNYNNKWSDNLPGVGYGNQAIMYWYIFWQPSADPNWLRNYWALGKEQRDIQYPFSSFPQNPFAIAYEYLNKSNRHNVTGNIQATYNFTKDLSVSVRSSLDMSYELRSQQRPYDAGTKIPKGSYRTQNIFSQEVSSDILLRYNKKINSLYTVTFTAGGSTLKNRYNKDEVRADSLTFPGVYALSNSAGPLVTLPYQSRYAINSFYGMIAGSYRDMLFADFTARQDWNSVLATPLRKDNSGFFYPSLNMSLVASEAFKLPKAINFAKLRFSVSGVGSGGTTPYLTAYNYTSAGSLYNGGLTNPSTLTNPDLRPLKTITYELGTQLRMFKNKLDVDVAVYTGTTKDQILNRIIDQATGYSQSVINAGAVRNKGIEVSVTGTPVIINKTFRWTTGVVFSANSNRVTELADSAVVLQRGPVGGGQIVAKVGGSMGDLYGQGYLRAPDGQVVYNSSTGTALLNPDVQYLGNTIPKWKLGFSNDFTYKQVRLHLLFDAQHGAVGHSLMHYKLAEQGKLAATVPGRYNGIIGNGVVYDAGTNKYRTNDVIATDIDEYYRSHWGIDNAEGSTFSTDFIKFREARLDYSLSPAIAKKIGAQRATIGVYGRDLFIWSPWPAFDPEFGTLSGTDIVRGFEIGQFPSTRTIGVNLVVTF